MVAMKKLVIDQLAFAPVMLSGFYLVASQVEGYPISKGVADMKEKFWATMLVNWQIWPPANLLNFALVPV
jgi:hypothetical protein